MGCATRGYGVAATAAPPALTPPPPSSLQHDAPIKCAIWVRDLNMLVTGSWDKTLKYWDLRSPTPAASVQMAERVVSMDVKYPLMVVATGDKKISIFRLDQPTKPYRTMDSPLSFQTRAVKAFHSKRYFMIASIEGRCAVRCVEQAEDEEKVAATGKLATSFAFKCHREGHEIFGVNALDAHPDPQFVNVFATAGADGAYNFWDRAEKVRMCGGGRDGGCVIACRIPSPDAPPPPQARHKDARPAPPAQPITAALWNPAGDLYAYAKSYDWSKGAEGYDLTREPSRVFVHHVLPSELRKKPV